MNLLLSVASGALLIFLFPRFSFTWLAPVALTPLLLAAAREQNWLHRFRNGWAAGIVFWFFTCVWIQFVLEVHGGMGRWGGWGTFLLFSVLKGAYTGTFAALAGLFLRWRWAALSIPALWCGIEHAHGVWGLAWLGLGFAWLDLGNAAIDWPILPRLAPFTGVHGISFVLAMTATALALVLQRKPWRELAPLAVLPLIFLLPALPPAAPGRELVQVLQPNVSTEARWTTESFAAFERRLSDLSLDEPAPLLVWPEAPAPFDPSRPVFKNYVSGIARSANAHFLFGGIAYTKDGAPLNSAFLLTPTGEIVERYDKIQLVPFGEYIPPAFNWVNRITGEAGDFEPGSRIVTMNVSGHSIGPFICYESAFPSLVRQFTLQGSELLVNLSNDGYFGGSAAREQHLSLVRMRAVENARWILRATNDGITAMIDPAGHVTDTIPPFTETSERMRFDYETRQTFYTRYGDWFPWMCLAASLVVLVIRVPHARRKLSHS